MHSLLYCLFCFFFFLFFEDPETGEEYLLRRGECVNVLPGLLKKVWTCYCTVCCALWYFDNINCYKLFSMKLIQDAKRQHYGGSK